jgi:hypothetical protein
MNVISKATGLPLLLAGVAGAAAQFFLDPHSGKRRRHVTRDRLAGFARRGSHELAQKARYAEGVAEGIAYKASTPVRQAGGEEKDFDALTLAHTVETEIFRDREVPKGDVNVNVEDSVVYLRGQLERPEQIQELVEAAAKVEGVERVENFLHLPGTPAPTKSKGRGRSKVAAGSPKS